LIKITGNAEHIRFEYFKKTIERAYQKAQQRKAILIARLGNWHANLTFPSEARYFAMSNSVTKGKVMSIQMQPVFEESGKESIQGIDLVGAIKPLMRPGYSCCLALPPLHGAARRALKYSQYYPGNRPICDWMLFVNAPSVGNVTEKTSCATMKIKTTSDATKSRAQPEIKDHLTPQRYW
jgi:hypothetical protein